MKDKDLLKLLQTDQNRRAMELYWKRFDQLSIAEKIQIDKFVFDYINPQWKRIYIKDQWTHYEVSNIGQVRNMKTNQILIANLNMDGYPTVGLSIHNDDNIHYHRQTCRVHRLVALMFIPNPENKPQVNHISGIKTCNWVGNLEWNTQEENITHAYATGLMRHKKGIESSRCQHTEEQVHQVCQMIQDDIPVYKIAEKLNTTRAFVMGIKYHGNWKEIADKYNFPNHKQCALRTDDQKQIMFDLVEEGCRNRRYIIESAGLPYDKTNISYVKYLIRVKNGKYKKYPRPK